MWRPALLALGLLPFLFREQIVELVGKLKDLLGSGVVNSDFARCVLDLKLVLAVLASDDDPRQCLGDRKLGHRVLRGKAERMALTRDPPWPDRIGSLAPRVTSRAGTSRSPPGHAPQPDMTLSAASCRAASQDRSGSG